MKKYIFLCESTISVLFWDLADSCHGALVKT